MKNKPLHTEEPEKLRPAIEKGQGTTESERYLARIAERSFLNLWSYPTPYRDQGQEGDGDGKEVCDLLVVCGKHVIIFSEKTVRWPTGIVSIAWRRWAKHAIRDAVKQIRGAERWINEFPDRIFLDRRCKCRFPIDFAIPSERVVHRIVVANGAVEACRSHSGSHLGSLTIDPSIHGEAHWPRDDSCIGPFKIGDIDPDGPFVHIFNEAAFNVVMSELDTITDFTDYLVSKEKFVRSGKLVVAEGEENLVAYYSIRINDEGVHDFVVPSKDDKIHIDNSHYSKFISHPSYIAKKKADRVSYMWDGLIELFTKPMLDGTSLELNGIEFDLRKSEIGVRCMALEPRFARRSFGEAIDGALLKGMEHDVFTRVMMDSPNSKDAGTAYFIRTLKYPKFLDNDGGYARYRMIRGNHAQLYAEGLLEKYPHLKRVVGISMEPPRQGRGGSEDMIYMEQVEWTDSQRKEIRENCRSRNLLSNVKERPWTGKEFPEPERDQRERRVFQQPPAGMNRADRRAWKAMRRKT